MVMDSPFSMACSRSGFTWRSAPSVTPCFWASAAGVSPGWACTCLGPFTVEPSSTMLTIVEEPSISFSIFTEVTDSSWPPSEKATMNCSFFTFSVPYS